MKKIVLILFLASLTFTSYSQTLVRLSTLKLTEDAGQIFKNPFGIEIGFGFADIDEKLQISASIGYFRSQSKKDEFLGYGIEDDGYDIRFIPTKHIYKNFQFIPMNFKASYSFLSQSFSPFVSLGLTLYGANFELDDSDYDLGGAGIQPDIGISYILNDSAQLKLSIGKLLSLSVQGKRIQFWQIGLTSYIYFSDFL